MTIILVQVKIKINLMIKIINYKKMTIVLNMIIM